MERDKPLMWKGETHKLGDPGGFLRGSDLEVVT